MSIKSQEKNMRRLAELLSQDLSYIYGERESGPNGAKKEFLRTGGAFIRALAKDLGFQEYKVSTNPSGIACSGEIYLSGMWSAGNGLFLSLEQMKGMLLSWGQMAGTDACILYRTITDIKNCTSGGGNHFITLREFSSCGYEALCAKLREMNREAPGHERAA